MTVKPYAAREDLQGPQPPLLDEQTIDVLLKLDEAQPLSEWLKALLKDIGLRDKELRALAQVSRATLARWRKEGGSRRPPALDDLRAIAVLLMRTGAMRPRSVAGWLRSRNAGLDWQRPLDVLEAGEFPYVLSAAEAACGARMPVVKVVRDSDRSPSGLSVDTAEQPV